MSVKNLLLWEKWRPKKFEDIILLPRIKKQFEDGVRQHYILYGHHGTGKTSLARILIGKYSKLTPFLEINCSLDTSIDVLREEIDNFCKFTPMMESDSDIKYVFLDEFERVSKSFQDAFKAFIEKYNNSVRFIITTNHINKITDELKSRVKSICFDCVDAEEEKFLKIEMFKRIQGTILPKEGKEVAKDALIGIINKKFPDLRSIIVELQDYLETGEIGRSQANSSSRTKLELYELIYSNADYMKTYTFLMQNFGAEKIDSMITMLGRPFIDWCIENKKDANHLFECGYVIADYSSKLESNTDPIILGMTILGKLINIVNR